MVLRYTTLVPSLGLRNGPACEAIECSFCHFLAKTSYELELCHAFSVCEVLYIILFYRASAH